MKKILFLHGFYASGSCVPAQALKEAFRERAAVLTPDLPLHPSDAIRLIREICDSEKPDILVGNSCGSFYAQMISPIIGVPALLGKEYKDITTHCFSGVNDSERQRVWGLFGDADTLAHF